jgi:hypothetical protein
MRYILILVLLLTGCAAAPPVSTHHYHSQVYCGEQRIGDSMRKVCHDEYGRYWVAD